MVNQLPQKGSCSVDTYNGTSLSTTFDIKCVDWIDPDGAIERYEYFGNSKNINLRLKKI